MADKVGLGSGSVPPQNIPPTQADASKAASPVGADGAESPSQYFYEVAQSGYEFLAKYAQAAAEAQKPKELKPEDAAAHFDQAEKEFQSTYKDAGTGPAAEAQAKSKIDAMQAAMPALMEQAKDPEVHAYLKEFQGGEAAEAESGGAAGTDASQQWGAPAPKDPAKAKAAFEILSRLRALEKAKHQYYSKYHKGSQDDLARRSLEKQQKVEARLKEVGEELRSQPDSVEAQRLLVEIDRTIGDDFGLHWDLEAWKKAAQGLKDPAAKVEELNSLLKVWSELGDNRLGQGAAEMQAKLQSLKDEIVATLRDNPKLISVDNKPVPNGAEHVRVMLDRIFPPPPSDTILQPELLSGLSLEGMENFARLSVEADAAMMSAMQKSQAGDAQGAKEDYLKALGAYAELRDEAAARAMDREIRKLLGRGDAPIEDYKMLGRIHAELKGSGLKLEAELKEEIASPEWMGFFLESSMKVTNRHLRGAESKTADGQDLAEILDVAENLIQAVKIRQEAGIANDDPVQLMEIDRLQLVMRKNADAKKLGSKERLELREKVVRLDVARFPEYVDALTRPIRGAWEPGLLDRIAHPERSGAIGVGIVAEDIGREMLEHLKAWEEDLDHSRLEPKEELDRRADMSAVLSLFYPLTKIGENPPLNQEQLTPLVRRNAEHLQALTSQVIAERFPMVARQPELLQAMGEDVSALSQEAVQRGDASFAALLRNPKGLEAFVAMSYKAYDLETRAKTLEAKVEAAKLKKMPEEKSAKWQAEALHLRMQAAELYSKRGGPPERVKTVLKPAMDFFEGVAADPQLSAAERAESLLDIAKLYQAVRLPEEAARVYEKIVAMERDRYLSGTVDEGLQTAATLAQGHRALLKEPPDYDAAKKFFQSLPGVEEAQRSYDAVVAYQRSQRLPKVLGALEAVAAEYAQKLEQRKGKAEAVKFRAEFKARAELFRDKLESGDYRAIEDLFATFGYVRHDAHQGRDFYKWAVGESDSIDWREFNEKSLSLLQAATNPEATDRDFAALGLEMGTYLGSAGDFDLFKAGAKDVAYFGAASQILDMMGNDRYVGTQAKSYRTGIANRSVIHETGVFLGNLSVVGAESLSEAGKSAALWLVPAGVGRLAGAGARLMGAGERLSILANVAASSLSGMLVESAWTGNWDAFSAKGLATTGTTTFISYFGYRHIARLSQKLGEAAKRSSTFGQRVAGQAAIGFSTRVMLEMGEFTAGGFFEAGMSFAQEGLGIQKVSELEQEASLILRIFSKVVKGGFEEKRENIGESFAGRLIDYSTGGWLHVVEQKAQLKDRQADIESAARVFGWDLDLNAARAWVEERRPVDGAKPGEKELAALLAMDPQRLEAVSKDPAKIAQAKEAVQKLYPDLDPNSWEAQLRAFQVLDYFEVKGKKGIAEQFAEFQKSAESLGIRSPGHLSAYYESAFRGLTPKQAKQAAKELAATPNLNDRLDVLVDAYVQPGAKLTDDLRDTMRAEVVLSLLEEAVASKKSPRALLERDVQAATPLAKAPEASPEAGPYRTQANFAGLPWTLGDIYEGFAKFLGITTQKVAKEQGWKQLDAWVETTSRDPGPSSDPVPSEALAKAVAQGGKKTARAADTLVEGSGITHPGLSEKLQLRLVRMGLDAGQISSLAKQAAKFQKGLRAIAEGLLGKGALDSPQGQLLAAELLLKAVEFGAQGKDPAKSLQYLENVTRELREAKPQLDAAAERLLQARDVHQSPAAYSVKTTLFLKALQYAATGKKFAASLAAWTEPALLGRLAEVLLETEATGVSTPQGRRRIAKKFIALLGAAGSPRALLGALYPAEARPVPLNPQGIASVEEVGGRARTKYAEIEVEAGKAWLFPNPGRKVEVYNPVTKTWIPAKEGQPLKSGTWIRQEEKDLGRKLFTLTPEGEVYLEEIGGVARRMEEGGSVLRALHENFPAWFGAGEALSMRTFGDLTKIVPEFFRRVERDRDPDWDRWYTEIASAVSALETAVQSLPEHQQAEFRIALMRKLAAGELTAERARAISEEVMNSPLDPALFSAGAGRPFGDFFGDFEARQPKQDYGDVFGDETPLGAEHEIDVFGDGAEMPPPAEEVVPQAIAAAEEDWWLGNGTAPDTESAGVDAVENVIPFLPPPRSKAPTVNDPDQLAAARLGQPEAIAKILGQEAMAEGMRQMETALQDSAEPAQILIRLPKGESREDAMVAVSEKADALKLNLEDFGGPGELVFLTPTGRKVLIKVEVEGAAPMSPPPKPLFQEEDEAEADAYYDEVLRALQHDTDRSEQVLPKAEAAPPPDEKDLLRGPIRDRMSQALSDFFGTRVNRATIAEAFPGAAEVFRVFEEAGALIERIERSDWGSKAWADLRKELEALRPRIEAADALWVQSQSAKYYMAFLDTAFTPLVVRSHKAPEEAEISLQAIQIPEWLDSPDFELGMLDDAARAGEGKPPRFAAPAVVLQTTDAEAAAKLEAAVLEKAEALGLELIAKKPGKLEFRTPMGGSFEVKIEAVPRRISLDPKADKISLGTTSYLERSGDSWIFKNPGKESWFIGADARGVITGEPVLRDGDLLVSFEGQAVVLEDPVLRAKPAFRTGSGVSALKIPEHPFDKISPPQELRDHGVRLGRNFDKIEVTYKAKPGEKLLIRRPGLTEPIEVKPLNEAASGGKSAKERPVAVALQAGDVLEIHTVAVGKRNPAASFAFGTYGGLVGLPKLPGQKPVLPGQLTALTAMATIDLEAVTEMDLPAVPPPAAPPWSGLLAGLQQIALHAVPFLPLMPVFVDAVLSQGLLGGGAQLSMAWLGKMKDKLKGLLPEGTKEEVVPAVFQAPVAAKIALKPFLVRDGGGEGVSIGGDGDRSRDGKILGQFHIPGLTAGVKVQYLEDYGVPKLYPAGMGGFEVQVRLKADDYRVKALKLTQEGIDFENGDQIVLPHAQGSVTLTLRVRQEGGKDVYEVETSRPLVELSLEGLPIGFPAGKNAFTFGERNEDDRRATAAGGVGAIQNPQTYGKIEKGEDGSFLLRPLAPAALRQIFLVDAQGAETPVTQPTRITPGQKVLVKNPTDPNPSSNRILFRFEHEADIPSVAAPAVPTQATPPAPADAVSPLEAGSYVWDAGLDTRYLPESTDVAVRHPDLTGEDILALLRRDGQDFWVLPRSEVVKVLDAGGRPLGLESGFDSQTGEEISQGYRVPAQAYLRIGNKLYVRQGTTWAAVQQDPWTGRSLRQTGDLEFEILDKDRPTSDTGLTPAAGPMPAPEIRAAAVVDPGAQKFSVENLPLAVQDNQPDKPRRAAYAQNLPTLAYGSFAAHTDEGLGGKSVNEDAYGVLPEHGVGIVADGMGGMGGGDKASAVAVAKLAEIVKDPNWNGDLKQALILAGRAVNQEVNPPSDPTKKAGTTAVIQRVVQKNGKVFAEIAHVGDAGALVLRPKPDGGVEVVFATREQSMVAEWRDLGSLKNTMEMRWSPQAHVVSGGLGLRKDAKPEFASVELQPGDWTLLFSDGIGDNFSKDELSVLVQSSKTPEAARDRILAALRLKMERLQTASAQLEAGQDVFLVPVQEKGADIEELEMVPIDGWQDYYLGEGGKVVGRAVRFKDAQGQVRTGVEVPWAEGRFAVRNAKGEMEYFQGHAVQGLDYFLPVDRYKADNVSIHVYKHELLPAPAEALDAAPTNPQLEEEWRIDDVLDETPQTLVSNIPPTQKMKPVQGVVPPPPTVKLAPVAEEIPPTYKLIQAVSAPKHPEEPGTPASPILARVGTREIDLSLAAKEPQVVYREGPVVVELSVDAIGRYLLKGRGFNWGSKPVIVEFEGKKFQLSRMNPSAPPLEGKPAAPPDAEKTRAAIAVGPSDFKAGLSESKAELAASDLPPGVEMELIAMPTALWDRDSDKNEVRVEDVLAEKPVSLGTLTREEAGGLTLQLRKELLPAYQVDVRDSSMALKKGAKGSVYDPIALAEGDRIGIGPMGIMKFVVARDEKGRLVLRPDGIEQKVRVHLSASGIEPAKSDQPSPFKKMIEDSMKAKASEEPALPALSSEERLAQASYVSPKERLGIVRDDKVLSDPLSFQRYIDSTKRLLGPELSKKLEFLLVDSPEGRVRIQKLREAVARRAGHSYANVDQLREYAVQALLQEGIDISERALKELGLQKSLGVVNLTLGEAFLPQLYPNDVPVALASEERKVWILGDSGFSALFHPQHPAVLMPGSTLGEIRTRGYLEALTGNMLVAGHQFSFKPYPGSLGAAGPVVQLEGQLFSFRQSGDVRAVFTFTSLANPKHQVVVEGPLGTDPKLAIEVARSSVKQSGKATALEDIIPLLLLENPQNIPVKLPLELRAFQILGWVAEQNGKTPRAYSVLEGVKDLVDKSGEPFDMHNTLIDMAFFDRYSLSLRAADRGRADSLLKMVQDSFGASLDPEQVRGPEPFADAKGEGLRLRLNLSQPSGVQSNGKMLEIKVYGPN